MDNKLRYADYVQKIAAKASQRMFAVENLLYLSSKAPACMIFKSFVISLLMYCLPILYTSIYARDKKSLRKVFHDANNLGLGHVGDLKYRSSWGKDWFLRQMCIMLNDILF